MKKLLLIGGLLSAAAVVGAPSAIPNTFTPGTPIKSAEVNENFKTLQTSALAHENRIQGLEAASLAVKPADQLICAVFSTWATGGTAFPCIQASAPSPTRSLTMEQVLAEGWISVAAGGGDNGNRVVMTFRK
jgi:hypothetical protein